MRRAKKEVSRVEAKFKFKIKNNLLDLKFFSCPGPERRPSPSMAALPPLTVRPLPPLPPPLSADTFQQSDAVTSLLSLSIAAADSSPRQHPTALSTTTPKHHRRLGSTGKTRRRLSDAREACTRPLYVLTHTPSSH